MQFQIDPNANISGTYLLGEADPKVLVVCKNKFADKATYFGFEPEKGYGDYEWLFKASNGQVFTIYTRWGCPRIGGVRGEVQASDFEAWLLAQA